MTMQNRAAEAPKVSDVVSLTEEPATRDRAVSRRGTGQSGLSPWQRRAVLLPILLT